MSAITVLIIVLLSFPTESRLFNVAVILNASDIKQQNVLTEATKVINRTQNKTGATSAISNPPTIRFIEHHLDTYPSSPRNILESYLNFTKNISSTTDLVIIMEITRDTVLLAQILKDLGIPTIGIQQRDIGASSSVSLCIRLI